MIQQGAPMDEIAGRTNVQETGRMRGEPVLGRKSWTRETGREDGGRPAAPRKGRKEWTR
jgi:hypothetical protein